MEGGGLGCRHLHIATRAFVTSILCRLDLHTCSLGYCLPGRVEIYLGAQFLRIQCFNAGKFDVVKMHSSLISADEPMSSFTIPYSNSWNGDAWRYSTPYRSFSSDHTRTRAHTPARRQTRAARRIYVSYVRYAAGRARGADIRRRICLARPLSRRWQEPSAALCSLF